MQIQKLIARATSAVILALTLTAASLPVSAEQLLNASFENGTEGFTARASESVTRVTTDAYDGQACLMVSNRTNSWNGAQLSLGSGWNSGESYSFSCAVMHNYGSAVTMQLSLQITTGSGTDYLPIASALVPSGKWAVLENDSYTIPSGSNMYLYIETKEGIFDFYVDAVKSSSGGSSSTNPPVTAGEFRRGDINYDGKVDVDDVKEMNAYLTNKGGKFADSDKSGTFLDWRVADLDGNNVINAVDASLLRRLVMDPEPIVTTTTQPAQPPVSDGALMDTVRSSFTKNVPANVQQGDTGTTTKITYYSSKAAANKSANVWVPAGYSTEKKYNVLYMNHGIFGNEDSMLTGFAVREMASNLIASGEVEPFIIVFPQMYTAPGGGQPGFGVTMEVTDNYDKILADMTDSLMPYIEENYSVYTGRDHTAVAGFSMGGRETLYMTIMRPDLFGYACASSPAPGIVPASDSFLANHLGSDNGKGGRLTNADFKIDKDKMPYLLMIGGGTADGVVGSFPEEYHNLFTQNGTDHIWQSFDGGGHDGSVGIPMFYNFFKNIFKK